MTMTIIRINRDEANTNMYIYACIGSTLMIVTIGRLLPKETTR